MISGADDLEVLAVRLEAVARLGKEGAEIAKEAIAEKARSQYAAQRSPSGDRWKPRKKDGSPALQRAPSRVAFTTVGDGIYQGAPDHYEFHRRGNKHLPKRNVYAEAGRLPLAWQAAAEQALEREYGKRMRA